MCEASAVAARSADLRELGRQSDRETFLELADCAAECWAPMQRLKRSPELFENARCVGGLLQHPPMAETVKLQDSCAGPIGGAAE
jgi:hypothetical protein